MPMIIQLPGLADASIYYAFRNSDVVGQSIVVGLFLFSMVTWCIMIEKGVSLKSAFRDSAAFLAKFRSKRNPMTFADRIEEEPSPAARVCEAAYLRISQMNVVQPDGSRRALHPGEIDIVRASLEQAVADQIVVLEGKMIFLATAVSISPFLGLFGTVWGIMLAFTELAIAGKADIQTLAPGVSGALLTTVLGLIVAIPSVVGYNIITSQIKSTIVHLDNFVEEFIVKLKIESLDEQEQQTQEKKEQEQKDQLEQALRDRERLQQQEQIRQEQARLERERRQFEQERQARLEQERLARLEQDRQAARLEQERQAARLEQERLARLEQERQAARLEQERLARLEQERQAARQEQSRQTEPLRPEPEMQEQPSLLQPDLTADQNTDGNREN